MLPDRSIAGVVLDLDDTLFPESDFVRGGFTAVAEVLDEETGMGADVIADAMWRALERDLREYGRARHVFDSILGELGLTATQERIRQLVATYRGHAPILTLYPDVPPLFDALDGAAKVGLITDGPEAMQRSKFDALDIGGRFDATLFTESMGRDATKREERVFARMEELLGLPAAELLYVGDNPEKDFVAARARGWWTVRVVRPGTLHGGREAAPGFEADVVLRDLSPLTAALAERLGR